MKFIDILNLKNNDVFIIKTSLGKATGKVIRTKKDFSLLIHENNYKIKMISQISLFLENKRNEEVEIKLINIFKS